MQEKKSAIEELKTLQDQKHEILSKILQKLGNSFKKKPCKIFGNIRDFQTI